MAKDITAKGYLSGNITAKANLSGDITASGALGQTVVVGGTILRPATTTSLGGIIVGEDLEITQQGVLSVTKANQIEQDNTHPITAAAVYTEVGNINALLQTI
jgi:hypothetical protein